MDAERVQAGMQHTQYPSARIENTVIVFMPGLYNFQKAAFAPVSYIPVVGIEQLGGDARARLDAAQASKTYEEYVFRCRVLDVPPSGEYEYDCNRYGRVLLPDSQNPNEFLLTEVEG